MAKRRNPKGRQRPAARAANSRRRRRRRTGKKTLHYILLVIFVLAAGTVLSLTTFFRIEAVTVVGTDRYPPEELAAASGIELEENLFRVSTRDVADLLISQYPYIESVEISRKLPPAIEIHVTQAVPAMAVLEGDEVVLVTRGGRVLERGMVIVPLDVPVVRGVPIGDIPAGEYLPEESEEQFQMVEALFRAMENTGFSNITNVDVTEPLNMLVIYENRLLLKLGTESELEHKLIFIQGVLDKLEPDEEGRLDVSDAALISRATKKDITLQEALALEYGRRSRSDGMAAFDSTDEDEEENTGDKEEEEISEDS